MLENDDGDEAFLPIEESHELTQNSNTTKKEVVPNEVSNITRTFEKGEVILSKLKKIIETEMEKNQSIDVEVDPEMPLNENGTTIGLDFAAEEFSTVTGEEDAVLDEFTTDSTEDVAFYDYTTAETEEDQAVDDYTTEQIGDESMFNMSNVDTLNQDQSVSHRNSFDWALLSICVIGTLRMQIKTAARKCFSSAYWLFSYVLQKLELVPDFSILLNFGK